MQFFHKCKNLTMETLTVFAVQKIEVLSFSVNRGKPVPHVSTARGLGDFSIDSLVCRTCKEEVKLEDSFSSCVISGRNYPIRELVFNNGYIYHPQHLRDASEIVLTFIGKKPVPLIQFLGGK